ncbi:MAG: internalization-related competence protein ComEC/Rec2 [Holophagaceae bacterium]|nr:internalization-related competence protein ComEC/Rec2 [Holophagaceae bacterium]
MKARQQSSGFNEIIMVDPGQVQSIMLSRTGIWQRFSGAGLWGLPWALALACALPWIIPETWDGQLSPKLLWLGWILVLIALPLLAFRRWRVLSLAVILAWITLLGLARKARWETALPEGVVELEARVCAPWSVVGERRVGRLEVLAPVSLKGLELPVTLPLEGEAAPLPGTPVRFRGELRKVGPAPGFLGERPLWRARSDEAPRRVHLRSALLMEVLGSPAPSPLLRFQVFMRRRFDALGLPPLAKDLWGALTLGLPPARDEVFSAFAESGTIHTLVVSGLQVTLVMGAALWLWNRLFRRGSAWSASAAGLAYALLVGFSAPVWRGLLMGFAWALGRESGWKLPPVLTLHGALLLWMLFHPAAGCEPGFLLAWSALLGLIWGAEPLAGLLAPLLGRWALPLARMAAPWFSTLPILALLHGGAPLWGIPANLLVLPLVVFLTPLCLVLTLVPIPGIVGATAKLLAWCGEGVTPFFARVLPLATGILWPWIALTLGWLMLAHFHAHFRRTRALVLGLVLASLGLLASRGTGVRPQALSLESVEIGQGDALLLRVPGGEATLVDTGGSPWSARRLVRVLSRRGVREPVHLILTHPHGDHAGGWSTLARLWPLASVRGAALAYPSDWHPFAPSLPSGFPLMRGNAWERGKAQFSVRWPPAPLALADANMASVVLRVRWQDRELWLMGDALAIQERDLLDEGNPGPGSFRRLLKPGHHGGGNATDRAWIKALSPEVVLITAGRHNRFGHPDSVTLATLERAGVPWVWVTGEHFGVCLEVHPEGWRITGGDGFHSQVSVPRPRFSGSWPPRSVSSGPPHGPAAAALP